MKQINKILLVTLLAFVLTACGGKNTNNDVPDNNVKSTEAVSPVLTDVPAETTPEATAAPAVTDTVTPEITNEPVTQTPDITDVPTEPVITGSDNTGSDTNTVTGDGNGENNSTGDGTDETAPKISDIPTQNSVPDTDTLCNTYINYLAQVYAESPCPDDLVFTTADINNDGIRELLYAESNVNAAGVFVCFYDNGSLICVGPFGCYGGFKYIPSDGRIVSAVTNMEFVNYMICSIDNNYNVVIQDEFSIEPDSENDSSHYLHNGTELSHDDFVTVFAPYQALETRAIDYYDMYWYCWCNDEFDPISDRMMNMLTQENEDGKSCRLIIPEDEMQKLIGTWEIYSHEIEGEVYYADKNEITGKVIIDENYHVTIYSSDREIRYKDLEMFFNTETYSNYLENTDWYVSLYGENLGGDEFYMNVTPDGQLFMNYINTENPDYYISTWDFYNKVSE